VRFEGQHIAEEAPVTQHGGRQQRPGDQADQGFSGEDLVAAMDKAARALIEARGEEQTAEQIVAGAIATIPPADQAGISLVERDRSVTSHAPSTDVVGELDRLQNELGEGPCLEAIHGEARIEIPDTAASGQRWPRWTAAAQERGVGSMLCLQLFARDGSAGALNLYATEPNAFDDDAQHLAGLFAAHAAVTLYGAQQVDHLHRALASRDEIGQAKGILMERFTLTPEQAFTLLTTSSQETNVKLATVARFLIEQVIERTG
jgi:transcriptional regulator with GAF, ATPase, and Fis domain